jgi:CelD/BcsL family acetyltransferase involved in cellulose biosynthesis
MRDARPGNDRASWPVVALSVDDDLAAVEPVWRSFEGVADATAFQSFDWLSAWQKHIGSREPVTPAIVTGRAADTGDILFIMPLAVRRGVVRELAFLGGALCDYNAPLLAPDFADRISPDHFRQIWHDVRRLLRARPQHRHDIVKLTKLPETIGGQPNPFLALGVGLNPSGAHVADLPPSWDDFYNVKRSTATRRRDRSKGKRLAEFGAVRLVTPEAREDTTETLDRLFEQKARLFARMGIADVFARPGHREFFFDLALDRPGGGLVHVSRLDIGGFPAAINYGLMFRGSYYHVVASYDDGPMARFGPGAAHLRELLRYAIGQNCRHFDFTIGDERYKLEWSDRVLRLYDHVAAATVRGQPAVAAILARRRITRTIKQNPRLWGLFSRLRAALGRKSQPAAADEEEGRASRGASGKALDLPK